MTLYQETLSCCVSSELISQLPYVSQISTLLSSKEPRQDRNRLQLRVVSISNDGEDGGLVSVKSSDGKKGVSIDTGECGGGRVNVYNPFGKNIATMQSSKTNTALIIVKDVNGKYGDALSGDK